METNNHNKQPEFPVPSVNVQAAVGAIAVGLWMMSINRRLKTVNKNVLTLGEGFSYLNHSVALLHQDSVTVRDVVRLAAEADKS